MDKSRNVCYNSLPAMGLPNHNGHYIRCDWVSNGLKIRVSAVRSRPCPLYGRIQLDFLYNVYGGFAGIVNGKANVNPCIVKPPGVLGVSTLPGGFFFLRKGVKYETHRRRIPFRYTGKPRIYVQRSEIDRCRTCKPRRKRGAAMRHYQEAQIRRTAWRSHPQIIRREGNR